MGSPHLLHVIAKINGRYRSLAVLYRHYDNRGEYAVQKCRRIIELFQEPRNRPLLLHELQLASSLPPEKWEATSEHDDERPAFPFVATCLLLGASVTPETGQGYNATHLPFNTPLGDADEGCTILDVTDPAAVRYAFVFVLPQGATPETSTAFGNTPLTAWEYAAFYGELFDEEDRLAEMLKGQEGVDSTVIASPLIDEDALESAWPHLEDQQSWRRRADLGLPVIVSRPSPANDHALPRLQPAAHHVEALYQAFDQSYKPFQPGYNEGLEAEVLTPVSPVKQVANILYLGSLDDKSWQARAAEYEPESRGKLSENAVQYFTFQVDDSPVTPGQTLDVMQSWMVAATAQEDLRRRKAHTYYFHSTYGQSAQNMVKFFSMAGPVRNKLPYSPCVACDPLSRADKRPEPPSRQAPARPRILPRQRCLPLLHRHHGGPRGDQARRVDGAPRPAVAPGAARPQTQDGDDPPGLQVRLRQPRRRRRDHARRRGDVPLGGALNPGGRRAPRAGPRRGDVRAGAGGPARTGWWCCQRRPGVAHGPGRGFGAAGCDGRRQGPSGAPRVRSTRDSCREKLGRGTLLLHSASPSKCLEGVLACLSNLRAPVPLYPTVEPMTMFLIVLKRGAVLHLK